MCEEKQERRKEGDKTKGFAVMCLRSFSIWTEVLFIRLKSIICAAAGEKTMGEY